MSSPVVGIDLGTLSVKGVVLDATGEISKTAYRFHQGNPMTVLRELLEDLTGDTAIHIAVTGSGSGFCPFHPDVRRVDDVQAVIASVACLVPEARNILDIGGASLTLVRLDPSGRFRSFSSNSQCAAGTGAFLDEQAMRLGLTYEEIANLDGVEDPPSVATRCAVFAKSDLIHLQQAGSTPQEMWSGLCRGMSQTALQTLLKGRPLDGLTALVGGVAQNREVLRWLDDLSGSAIVTDDKAPIAGALGAALVVYHDDDRHPPMGCGDWLDGEQRRSPIQIETGPEGLSCPSAVGSGGPEFARAPARSPLALQRTHYPSFAISECHTDDLENEIRISRWPEGDPVSGTLGIDIGSTSTKLCFIDHRGEVIVDIYRKTAGDPIDATKKLLDALSAVAEGRGVELEVEGCGTTGSGRKLVGRVVAADAVINEISAHVAGAMRVDPELETIFEIGGQDSKYVRVRNGQIVDANMNYVCAAGTGSFVEEQARRLGIPIHEVGDLVLGLVPPQTSDRCTVFMGEDVSKLLRSGHDPSQALAAVMRSVVQNYLNKVVGNRYCSPHKIGFQGATARNKGVVAAFETLLGVEVVVSPYCHVMGAWGVALLTQKKLRKSGEPTGFVGLDLSRRQVTLRKTRCDLCNNGCELTFANIEGRADEPSWGYMCGRDPDATRMKVSREYDLFRKGRRWLWRDGAAVQRPTEGRRPVVGLPRALTSFSQLPLYRRLLEELGAEVILSEETTRRTRERGAAMTAAEFCFPVKLGHGQIAEALERGKVDFLFVPHFVAQPPLSKQSNTFMCPYVQALPRVVATALETAGIDPSRILAPIIDRRTSLDQQVRALYEALRRPLGVRERQVRGAWEAACAAQDGFEKRFEAAGLDAVEELQADIRSNPEARPGIVFIGRPYSIADASVSLDLPRKISEMGYRIFPMGALPFDPVRIHEQYQNLFWEYGQRIVSALEFVRDCDELFAIYLTNFNCGPDSFLLSYAEEIMGDKPMLSLELDEHGADGGYITRIEAFLDVTRSWRATPRAARPTPRWPSEDELRKHRIWIPPIHPVGSRVSAAAFRGAGYDAAPLPIEGHADLEVGQELTRGCECLPMRTTVGAFVNATSQGGSGRPQALFMPTAKGPCRFGQYNTLERLIFDRIGRPDTLILSPSSDNNYYGLPELVRRRFWEALLASDALFKASCRVRPYESTSGDSDQILEKWSKAAEGSLETGGDPKEVLRQAGEDFIRIPTRNERRPLVGVVGEIYIRNNAFSNEGLVRAIEDAGGEAWVTPLTEWILFTASEDISRLLTLPKSVGEAVSNGKRLIRSYWMQSAARAFDKAMGPVIADRHEPPVEDTLAAGRRYLPFNIGGEALLSLGRSVHFGIQGAAMVINASPFSCMVGTVCAALFTKMENELQIPIVSLFYDGRGGENARLPVFLANLDRSAARAGPPQVARKSGFSLRKNPFARGRC